jgi:uncharacterized lipoprotein YddW (UPF0748 family)
VRRCLPRRRLLLLALGALACAPSCSERVTDAQPREPARRYLWVTRWDCSSAQDVERLVSDAAGAGFDALVFQVRGAASTFYPSEIEPRAPELSGMPAGYDPLRIALDAAHARGLELHAWINCVPSWWGTTPPEDPRHVYNAHPEWHWYDQEGRRQALSERFYVSLNPCLPAVRAHVVAVCEELVTGYELDGLHLDYIRFPNEAPATRKGSGSDWPRDAATLALYRVATGLEPDEDRERWSAWRAEQVTALVRGIRAQTAACAPGLVLSTAVGAEPERALAQHFQDVDAWIDEGLVDLVLPMNYTSDLELFTTRLERWRERAGKTRVAMGVMVKGDPGTRVAVLRLASDSYPALAVFGYHELFDSNNEVLTVQDEGESALRAQRRRALLPELVRGLSMGE